MKITKERAVSLMVGLGYKTAGQWDNEKLSAKMKSLKDEFPDSSTLANVLGDNKTAKKDLDAVFFAIDNKKKIIVLDVSDDAPAEIVPPKGKERASTKEKSAKEKAPAKSSEKSEKPAKKEKAAKKSKSGNATKKEKRVDCVCDILKMLPKSGMSAKDISQKANNIFVKQGGKNNVVQTLHYLRVVLPILKAFKIVIEKDNKIYQS